MAVPFPAVESSNKDKKDKKNQKDTKDKLRGDRDEKLDKKVVMPPTAAGKVASMKPNAPESQEDEEDEEPPPPPPPPPAADMVDVSKFELKEWLALINPKLMHLEAMLRQHCYDDPRSLICLSMAELEQELGAPEILKEKLDTDSLTLPRALCLSLVQHAIKLPVKIEPCSFDAGFTAWLASVHPEFPIYQEVLYENAFDDQKTVRGVCVCVCVCVLYSRDAVTFLSIILCFVVPVGDRAHCMGCLRCES